MRRIALASLCLVSMPFALAQGGAQVWGAAPALGATGPGAPDALSSYRLPAERFAIDLGQEVKSRSFVRREVSFPSPVKERWPTIHGTYYAPTRTPPGKKLPAAVVVHHLGGDFGAEAYLAQHLAQNGVPAIFIALPNYGLRREKGTKQGFLHETDPVGGFTAFRQSALDVIRSADFLRAMPEVDPERVGVVGVSLGAVVSALARGVDTRLGKTVLVIGGGDVLGLLRDSPEVQGMLDKALAKAGIDASQLATILAPVDPVTFAGRIRTQDVLMINARRDEIIPERCTLSLWEAMGRPKIEWMDCGHYGVALHIFKVMNASLDHLRDY